MLKVKGYLHVFVETIIANKCVDDIHANISLGQIVKTQTLKSKSNSQRNEVFLLQVPNNPQRLSFIVYQGEKKIGQCRYDIQPFFNHQAMAHTIQSELYNDQNQIQGKVNTKITYFSAQYGKLKIRVFQLSLHQNYIQQFKQAKLKIVLGLHAQTGPLMPLSENWDITLQILVLAKSLNLTFSIIHQQGVLGTYTIYNIEKSGLLIDQTKAYQVSLFNNQKPIGNIKYQIDWIRQK